MIWPPLSRFPFPHAVDELVAAEIGALLLLEVELAFDHHLGGDPGMVGADHPQGVLALQAGDAGEDVLQRIVERMADVEAAGDVGRRHDDGERLGVGARRAEQALALPMGIPAGLDGGGVEGFGELGHGQRLAVPRCSINLEGPTRNKSIIRRLLALLPDCLRNRSPALGGS